MLENVCRPLVLFVCDSGTEAERRGCKFYADDGHGDCAHCFRENDTLLCRSGMAKEEANG